MSPPTKLAYTLDDGLAAGELEFALAMERYMRFGHGFPTWREVLLVLKALGYRKVVDAVLATAAAE